MGAPLLSRRTKLSGTVAGAAALALSSCSAKSWSAPENNGAATTLAAAFDEFDAKVEAGMKAYGIPGVAPAI